MKTILSVAFFSLILLNLLGQTSKIESNKMKLVWEARGFDTPESVCYDELNNFFYVSNVGGKNPEEKDGNGFISKLNADGTIAQLKWVEGLNAPKGMGIYNGFLFVTDIDRLVIIDIEQGKIEEEVAIAGAKFLNDIAVDDDGVIYISDSKDKKFYKLYRGKYNQLAQDESFAFPNGVIFDKSVVVAGVGNSIVKIDPVLGTWEMLIDNTGGVDGLAKVGEGEFIISDWAGKIQLVSAKNKQVLLDTTPIGTRNAADFCYMAAEKKLLVPTFFGNSVACYQLNF
jgi:DNA-binding beta-propeller fold protein YncE